MTTEIRETTGNGTSAESEIIADEKGLRIVSPYFTHKISWTWIERAAKKLTDATTAESASLPPVSEKVREFGRE